MATENIRKNILQEMLQKIADDEKLDEYTVETKEIACTGQNYTAAIYLIEMIAKSGSIHLFAKVAKANEGERIVMQIEEMYKRERFVYLELVKIFNDIQDKFNLTENRYYFARYFASNDKPMEEALVLENLLVKDYFTPSRFEPMDWFFASKAIEQLAKFHALSFVFEKENPDMYASLIKTKDEFMYTKNRPPADISLKYTKQRVDSAMKCLTPSNKEKFEAFLQKNDPDIKQLEQYKLLRRSCLLHGDYKHTNIMTRPENGMLAEMCPVDYQMIYYGSPINDIMYFIFTGSDEKFRNLYYTELIELYYCCLSKSLASLSYKVKDIYPREDFDEDLKERTIYGIYIGLYILPYMLATKKPDFDKKADEIVIDDGVEYKERFNGIVNDFVKWGYM